jgi:2-haloacid dehalogenase
MRRREFLAVPAVGGLLALSSAGARSYPTLGRASANPFPADPSPASQLGVKALVFDTFGTVVDWRGSIIREGTQWGQEKGLQVDWGKFADKWRSGYGPAMEKVRKGTMPWTKLDVLHRMLLEDLLKEFNITGLTEEEKDHRNRVWHRLTPWPDAVDGLTLLKKNFIIATLSNGNVSLLVEMAKFAQLPWDTILSAELFHHYKPDPEVYLGAVELLSCKPAEVMMVAAHPDDLKAAQSCGLRAAFVPRPLERGSENRAAPPGNMAPGNAPPAAGNTTPPATAPFDIVARDFVDLAAKLS